MKSLTDLRGEFVNRSFWQSAGNGFSGAGLFRDLRCPRESRLSDEPDEWDRRYAIFARVCAMAGLLAVIIGAAILWHSHRLAAGALLAFGALRVVGDIPVK
jgi:hypothetical protein